MTTEEVKYFSAGKYGSAARILIIAPNIDLATDKAKRVLEIDCTLEEWEELECVCDGNPDPYAECDKCLDNYITIRRVEPYYADTLIKSANKHG